MTLTVLRIRGLGLVALFALLPALGCKKASHATDGGVDAAVGGGDDGATGGDASSGDGAVGDSGGTGAIAVAPTSVTVVASGDTTFTCTVTGLANASCTWAVQEAMGGTITSAGVYTAPATGGTYHVVATSVGDTSLHASASVVVPTVGACDSLASVGTWENITPAAFMTPANQQSIAVAVNPQQPNIVYAAAGNITNGPGCPKGQTCPRTGSGVYKSTDCGKTFTLLSKGPSDAFTSGDLWAIRIAPSLPTTMYTMNGYGNPPTLFKSTDAGATWTNLFSGSLFTTSSSKGGTFQYGGFVRSFDVDAADASHVVVAFHENCMGPIAASSPDAVSGAVMCLGETRDGGTTWTLFEGPIPPANADGGAPTILGTNALVYSNPGTGSSTGWYMGDATRKLSSWKTVLSFDMTGAFYALNQSGGTFDADGALYLGGTNDIVVTQPGASFGQTWSVVAGSPQSVIVGSDGRTAANGGMLFASGLNPTDHMYTGSIDGKVAWKAMTTPAGITTGMQTFSYDTVHHVLYGAGWSEGLWRVVTY